MQTTTNSSHSPFFIHLKYPSCISLKTLLQLDSFSITSQEETSFLLSVFHLLVLLPSVCLHAPLTSVYVHVCVCVCLSAYGFFSTDCTPSKALTDP